MEYLSVAQIAKLWKMSERSVRNYCAQGKIKGAFLTGKTWNIPQGSIKPTREKKIVKTDNDLLNVLLEEKSSKLKGGIYHKTQISLTYNSNHIEGNELTEDQTRYIFETNTISISEKNINVDDIIETSNHFRCIDFIIKNAKEQLTEKIIKELHFMLKVGTSDSRKDWFKVGKYKKLPNEVGGQETTQPEQVENEMKKLLNKYNLLKTNASHNETSNNENSKDKTNKKLENKIQENKTNNKLENQTITLENILAFHHDFESIHPFQDGNGRVGRLIMFKECLASNIIPFIIDEELKLFYYRGLKKWQNEKSYLTDTCLSAQDKYKQYLNYFKIKY